MARLLISRFRPLALLLLPFSSIALSCGGDGASSSTSDSALEQKISELETQIQKLSDTTLPKDVPSSSAVSKVTIAPVADTPNQQPSSNSVGVTTPRATTQPVVTQPVVTQPVVTQPVVTQPVVTQPVVTQPVVTQPSIVCPSGAPTMSLVSLTVASSFADPIWSGYTYYLIHIEGQVTNNSTAALGWFTPYADVAFSGNSNDFYRTPSPRRTMLFPDTATHVLKPGQSVRVRGSANINGSSTTPTIENWLVDDASWDDVNFRLSCPSP